MSPSNHSPSGIHMKHPISSGARPVCTVVRPASVLWDCGFDSAGKVQQLSSTCCACPTFHNTFFRYRALEVLAADYDMSIHSAMRSDHHKAELVLWCCESKFQGALVALAICGGWLWAGSMRLRELRRLQKLRQHRLWHTSQDGAGRLSQPDRSVQPQASSWLH